MKRYVLVEMDVDDWGAVDAALYVQSRDIRGFMGTITASEVYRTKSGKILTDDDIEALADEAEAGYDVDPDKAVAVGQRRRTAMGRTFTVTRLNVLTGEALLRFDDKTTQWWELDWVRKDSTVVPMNPLDLPRPEGDPPT